MKKAWLVPAVCAAVLLAYIALTIWQPGGSEVLLVLTHAAWAVCAWLAAMMALRAGLMFEPGVSSRRVWLMFGAGMTVLAFSETLWLLYRLVNRPMTYPSLIDISWGIGFVPILASIVLHYRSLQVQLRRWQKLLVLDTYVGLLLVAVFYMAGYILANPGHVAVVQLLVSAYYLVASLGVAFLAIMSLMYLEGGLVARPWYYLAGSILMFAVGGLAFSFGTWTNTYETGANTLSAVADFSYLAGYVLAIAGAYTQLTLRLPSLQEG
jgi:hypothetical protein